MDTLEKFREVRLKKMINLVSDDIFELVDPKINIKTNEDESKYAKIIAAIDTNPTNKSTSQIKKKIKNKISIMVVDRESHNKRLEKSRTEVDIYGRDFRNLKN